MRGAVKVKKTGQVILLAALIFGAAFFIRFVKYQYDIQHIQINPIAFADVKDGTYHGEYDLFLVKTKVTAKVEDGVLKSLILDEHVNGKGQAAEPIVERILEAQTMEVDMVTGATASSKAIVKALEDALYE